jgi:hypothetical protein
MILSSTQKLGKEATIFFFFVDGSFADKLLEQQQSEEEPMDWDGMDPKLMEELSTVRTNITQNRDKLNFDLQNFTQNKLRFLNTM